MVRYGKFDILEFEWDEAKDLANQHKHRVTFLEATECFFDPDGLELSDTEHSCSEPRFYWVGKSTQGRVLTIWYTKRGDIIRIIGAANWRKMRKIYETAKLRES